MEFKTILYILIGIAWVVYHNYKKIVEENKKRNLPPPPFETPQRPVVVTAPASKPIPEIPSRTQSQKKPVPSLKQIKVPPPQTGRRVFKEREKPPRSEIVLENSLEQLGEFEKPKAEFIEAAKTIIAPPAKSTFNKQKKLVLNINDRNFLRTSFIVGELLNKPRYDNAF